MALNRYRTTLVEEERSQHRTTIDFYLTNTTLHEKSTAYCYVGRHFHFRDSEFGNTVFPQHSTAQFKEALTTGSTYLSWFWRRVRSWLWAIRLSWVKTWPVLITVYNPSLYKNQWKSYAFLRTCQCICCTFLTCSGDKVKNRWHDVVLIDCVHFMKAKNADEICKKKLKITTA